MAASIIPLAAQHTRCLQDSLENPKFGEPVRISQDRWVESLCEGFLAYFCLASLHVHRHHPDFHNFNKYGSQMLAFLRTYPEEPHPHLVGTIFSNSVRVDDAVDCYVNDRLSESDLRDLTAVRTFLQLSEENALGWFAGKLHVRLMRILGVQTETMPYLTAWLNNTGGVIAAVRTLKNWTPVLKS
jgi:hypothetical protein